MGGSGLAEGEVLNSGVYSTEDSLGGGALFTAAALCTKKLYVLLLLLLLPSRPV